MTDIVIVALIAASPGVIAAIASIRNGKKADDIHLLVNSNLTAVKDQLAAALTKVESLEKVINNFLLPNNTNLPPNDKP
jgi:hypothetical protein